jgi:hypothetical protein
MVVDMSAHSFQFEPEWIQKLEAVRHIPNMTYSDLASLVGRVLWAAFVREIPLSLFPHIITTCRIIADNIASGFEWSNRVPFDTSPVRMEIDKWMFTINSAFKHTEHVVDAAWLTSDGFADEFQSTWAFVSGDTVFSAKCDHHMNIFMAELLGAVRALEFAARHSSAAILELDNMGLVYALNKGHSCLPVADRAIGLLLSRLPRSFAFSVRHVHSEFNIGDRFTREDLGTCTLGPMCTQRVLVSSWG